VASAYFFLFLSRNSSVSTWAHETGSKATLRPIKLLELVAVDAKLLAVVAVVVPGVGDGAVDGEQTTVGATAAATVGANAAANEDLLSLLELWLVLPFEILLLLTLTLLPLTQPLTR
jgi:hypothetical protein